MLNRDLLAMVASTNSLNATFLIGPLSSSQGLPKLFIPPDVVDGDFEWKWQLDITNSRTICSDTIAEVAPATQLRSDVRLVTLLGPATPVVVYCPPGSNYVIPGKRIFARVRVNLFNILMRGAHGTPYQVLIITVTETWPAQLP